MRGLIPRMVPAAIPARTLSTNGQSSSSPATHNPLASFSMTVSVPIGNEPIQLSRPCAYKSNGVLDRSDSSKQPGARYSTNVPSHGLEIVAASPHRAA
jgi:hypothetical protein